MSRSFLTATAAGLPLTAFGDLKATAPALGIGSLTLYAFSSDNWGRPLSEVNALLTLLEEYFRTEAAKCAVENVRLRVIGRRDRIPPTLADAIQTAERLTANCRGLQLRIAVDYSSRHAT